MKIKLLAAPNIFRPSPLFHTSHFIIKKKASGPEGPLAWKGGELI